MANHKRKDINMTGSNDFDLPEIPAQIIKKEETAPEIIQPIIEQKPIKPKIKDTFVRLNLERIPVVKVSFEYPEEDDLKIELIAVKDRKTKKDLLAEIVQEWLRRNKSKII
jgi:hypothetical protein